MQDQYVKSDEASSAEDQAFLFNEEELVAIMEQHIPFNRFLGIKVHRVDRGAVRLALPPNDEFTGDPIRPALHGGVIATLADSAAGLVVFSVLQQSSSASTIDLRVDYLRPARVDLPLYADAHMLRSGTHIFVTQVNLHHGDEQDRVAIATVTFNVVNKPNLMKLVSTDL